MAKPWIIITGATGFLGGQLVGQLVKEFRIYAMGRRTPRQAGVPEGPGVEWFQVDIGIKEQLKEVFETIRQSGGADILLHMAAYYDFSGEDHPEYTRTNVLGTKNLLELATTLNLRRFIFTSSAAACPFPAAGRMIDETTAPTSPEPYSRSKRVGEELTREYARRMPTCIVRPAAVFSEWCEYEPLDVFIRTWCSRTWNSRILGGRGLWAVPFLHVQDLISFFIRLVEKSDELAESEVLMASPDGCTTVRELFREVTRCYYGRSQAPLLVPYTLAKRGIAMREWWGRRTGNLPFEREWMADYIDRQLKVDASRTRGRLDWANHPGRDILACIPAMVENFKEHREEWTLRSDRKSSRRPFPVADWRLASRE